MLAVYALFVYHVYLPFFRVFRGAEPPPPPVNSANIQTHTLKYPISSENVFTGNIFGFFHVIVFHILTAQIFV